MAWTAPRTWVATEVPTASMMNTYVRDNHQYLYDNRMPAGTIIFYAGAATCPDGWSEYTLLRQYTPKGLPSGGTLNGVVNGLTGSAPGSYFLTLIPTHDHGVGSVATSSDGDHWHTVSANAADAPNVVWPEVGDGSNAGTQTTLASPNHEHTISGNTDSSGGTVDATMPFITYIACQKGAS